MPHSMCDLAGGNALACNKCVASTRKQEQGNVSSQAICLVRKPTWAWRCSSDMNFRCAAQVPSSWSVYSGHTPSSTNSTSFRACRCVKAYPNAHIHPLPSTHLMMCTRTRTFECGTRGKQQLCSWCGVERIQVERSGALKTKDSCKQRGRHTVNISQSTCHTTLPCRRRARVTSQWAPCAKCLRQ